MFVSIYLIHNLDLYLSMGEVPRHGEELPVGNRMPDIRKLKEILKELDQTENTKHRLLLRKDIRRAREVLKRLERQSHLRALTMNESVLRGLRRIHDPKKPVRDITVAFLLLLGEYEGHTRVCWKSIETA